MASHPLQRLGPAARLSLFLLSLALTLALMATLRALDVPLRTPAAPAGIVSFELAGSLAAAQAILDSWGEEARVSAALSLGLDYLYLVVYSTAIALACLGIAGHLQGRWRLAQRGGVLAWGLWLAAVLDAVENMALIRLLLGSQASILPAIARWAAMAKFALILAGLGFVMLGGVAALLDRVTQRR